MLFGRSTGARTGDDVLKIVRDVRVVREEKRPHNPSAR